MSYPWREGELAVCVDDGDWQPDDGVGRLSAYPVRKGIYRVRAAHFLNDGTWLQFKEWAGQSAFDAEAFRPLNDAKDDAELITRIRACKPTRTPIPTDAEPFRLPLSGVRLPGTPTAGNGSAGGIIPHANASAPALARQLGSNSSEDAVNSEDQSFSHANPDNRRGQRDHG